MALLRKPCVSMVIITLNSCTQLQNCTRFGKNETVLVFCNFIRTGQGWILEFRGPKQATLRKGTPKHGRFTDNVVFKRGPLACGWVLEFRGLRQTLGKGSQNTAFRDNVCFKRASVFAYALEKLYSLKTSKIFHFVWGLASAWKTISHCKLSEVTWF